MLTTIKPIARPVIIDSKSNPEIGDTVICVDTEVSFVLVDEERLTVAGVEEVVDELRLSVVLAVSDCNSKLMLPGPVTVTEVGLFVNEQVNPPEQTQFRIV